MEIIELNQEKLLTETDGNRIIFDVVISNHILIPPIIMVSPSLGAFEIPLFTILLCSDNLVLTLWHITFLAFPKAVSS